MQIYASLKADLMRVETYIRTGAVAALTGATAAAVTPLHTGTGILFTSGRLHTLAETFIAGAVLSVLPLPVQSPLTPVLPVPVIPPMRVPPPPEAPGTDPCLKGG